MRFLHIVPLIAVASCAFSQDQVPPFRREAARLPIKRATDAAASGLVSQKARKTTIEEMLSAPRPEALGPDSKDLNAQNRRFGPFETTVWEVEVTIKEIVLRADGDYYMVIESPSGARTVVEVPDPRLCPNSKLIKRIQEVRNLLAKKFHPTSMPQTVNEKATITGAGFFGLQGRGATPGTRSNGARLMPGLGVKFK